jgi:hypothetical protein
MRPICGAIIAAGALVGLGLTSIGIGLRYQNYPFTVIDGEPPWVKFRQLDTALMMTLVVALIMLVVGMALAFLGLAYHHHRRNYELFHPPAIRPIERVHS